MSLLSRRWFPIILILAACGDNLGGSVAISGTKTLHFEWDPIAGTDHYELVEDLDGSSDYVVRATIEGGRSTFDLEVPVHLLDWDRGRFLIRSCPDVRCQDPLIATTLFVDHLDPIDAIGYLKAWGDVPNTYFGGNLALSADGDTIAVSAPLEEAVYVFVNDGDGRWLPHRRVRSPLGSALQCFGRRMALSSHGDVLVVGADCENGTATGVWAGDGGVDQQGPEHYASGAVFVFERAGDDWLLLNYIKASNAAEKDRFGTSVALSADGSVMAVGAWGEDSNATGVTTDLGAGSSDSLPDSGAVYLFARDGAAGWRQEAYVKAANPSVDDLFGVEVSLAANGQMLAVSAVGESSSATGIHMHGGAGSDDDASDTGAVYLFARRNEAWLQEAYVKASDASVRDQFGRSMALSNSGDLLVATTSRKAGFENGVAYVFSRGSSEQWQEQGVLRASNGERWDGFGADVAVSGDGSQIVVSASLEDSGYRGVSQDGTGEDDESAYHTGAAYVFVRDDQGQWHQKTYVKRTSSDVFGVFGDSVALSEDGRTLAVGAPWGRGGVYLY